VLTTPPATLPKKSSGSHKRRQAFSNREDAAIREGVAQHGNKWTKILAAYPAVFHSSRDRVAINQRWERNLNKKVDTDMDGDTDDDGKDATRPGS
jgi:hypothetical protein